MKQDADFDLISLAVLQGEFDEFAVQSAALAKATASGSGIYQETFWNGEEWITTERTVEVTAEFEFQGEIQTFEIGNGSHREGNFYEIKYRYRFGDILKSVRFGDLEFNDPGSLGFIEETRQQWFVK